MADLSRKLTNQEIARQFQLLADLLQIQGEPIYRVSAYRRAAETISALSESLGAIRERGELREIPSVGAAIAEKIGQLLDSGEIRQLRELQTAIPAGVADLLAVPDIGPKRAGQLWEHLRIDSVEALRIAVHEGRLLDLPGLGPKGAERIANGLDAMITDDERRPLPVAMRMGNDLIARFRDHAPMVARADLAGSARRGVETVGDLDIVAAAEDPAAAVEAFATLPGVARVEMRGPNRCRVLMENGFPADLRVLPERHWGSLLHHLTGSKRHNVRLRDLAIERGASMSEYGYQVGDDLITCGTEEEVYAFLDLPWMPPTIREHTGEIERAQRGDFPSLVAHTDICGETHCHSTWSDGAQSIREMAEAARTRGYEYLCITDHSHGLAIANGLSPERLTAQREEIDAINADLAPFRVLQGVEVNVRSDGALDLPDDVLTKLDMVIGSVHGGLREGRERFTARTMAALNHPLVDIVAHPTGRVLGGRIGADLDIDAVCVEAARTGTALEINGSNLDLRDTHVRTALAAGATISLGADAHSTDGLEAMTYAVMVAQRAWTPPDRVLNAGGLDAFLGRLKRANSR